MLTTHVGTQGAQTLMETLFTTGRAPMPWKSWHPAPTYYAARGTCSILDIAFAKNLILEDINSVNDLSSDHNPVLIDLALNNSLPKKKKKSPYPQVY
ncbi:hypothetical protein TNCV_929691 [Trichonephila clavipes]|nr:hypothetical protein TNCV_929691 [Trichonephila clavipes]